MLPLLKFDYSISKSILQVGQLKSGEHNAPDQPDCLADIITDNQWKKVFLVEDSLCGFIPSYLESKKAGAQMIFGWRVTVVEDGGLMEEQAGGKMVIFVKSEAGWGNLVKMATLAQIDYFHNEPRLDWKTLQKFWSDELVLAIPFYDSFLHLNLTTKKQSVPDFGAIKPYVFIEDNDVFFDGILTKQAREYASVFNLPIVETKSCYYKNRADFIYFQARKLMDRKTYGGGNMEEPNLEYFSSHEFCIESALEHPFGDEKFEKEFEKPLELFLPGVRLPEFILDPEDKKTYKIPEGASDIEILRILARHGYKEKLAKGEIPKEKAKEYGARVNFELDILEKTDFDPYILLVWDVMNFVRKNGLAHGAGRGSAAGSLLNFLLGITDIDPIENSLYFERFISISRAKTDVIDGIKYILNSPDIDIDLGAEARERVIEYLSEKYKGRFVKLSTYNTKTTKALLKDAGKVIGLMSEEEIKVYSDLVPVKFGKVAKPEKAYEEDEKLRAFFDKNPLVYGCVKKLQGLIGNMGSHASAYLVSYNPLDEFMPLQYGTDNEIVTCCDADVSEKMVIKLDLLGLQSVTLLDNVVTSVGIDPAKVDYNSWDDIYVYLQELETSSNLFQISGSAAVRGLNKIKPRNMEMLADVLAICRPGSFVFIDQYADYMNGVGEKPSLHPIFDDILEKTGGVMLYQESLMQMFNRIGFSLAESDDIRRIVGKKKTEEIAEWEPKIYEKCRENNIPMEAGEALWKLALASADYSFNKCAHPNTLIELKDIGLVPMHSIKVGDEIKSFDITKKKDIYTKVLNIYGNKKELYEVELVELQNEEKFGGNQENLICSIDHKILCKDMIQRSLGEILHWGYQVCFSDRNGNIRFSNINVERFGLSDTLDFEVDHPDHNFYGNGIVISNSHSYAYARTTALSVYCKFKYPSQFFLEALKLTKEKQDPSAEIAEIVQELSYFDIKLLPPSLTKSEMDFSLEGRDIRFGLSAVKGISSKSITAIQQFIDKDKTNLFDVFQAAQQSKVNVTVLNALIEVGCLDSLTTLDRQRIALAAKIWKELNPKEQAYCLEHGEKFEWNLNELLKTYLTWVGANGKPIGKESRLETIRKNCAGAFALFRENSLKPEVSQYLFEKKLLGYCPSMTLSDLFEEFPQLSKVSEVKYQSYEKERVCVVAEVKEVKTGIAKKTGNKYAKIKIADETGAMECLFTGDRWSSYLAKFGEPQEDQLIYLEGSKGGGDDPIIFIDKAEIQCLKIFQRVSDLKRYEEKEQKKLEKIEK